MVKDLISIIVPVYNGEKGIGTCLDSLIAGDYKNIEIIVVNDGSKDNTKNILEEYKVKDSRIKPFHIENGGVSGARNYGIEKSEGEFIMFIDGDDTLDKEALAEMYSLMEEDVSFAHFGMRKITEDGKPLDWQKKLKRGVVEGENDIIAAFFRKDIMSTACAKLYRRELIGDTRFDTKFAVGEDELFSFFICKKAKKVALTASIYYNYIENADSVMRKNFTEKHFQALSVMDVQIENVKDNKALLAEALLADTIRCNELMWKIFDTKKMYEKFDFLRNRMMERKSLYLSSKDITSKEKLLFILLWLMPKLYYNLKLKQNS